VVDYWMGARLARSDAPGWRRLWLTISLAFNLGLLGLFKYAGFLAEALDVVGLPMPDPGLRLPIGISFYTFHSLSYTIDLYRRTIAPARSLLDYACFVSLFPHLVAGPILRAGDLLPQIAEHRPFQREATVRGLELCLIGFFKKAVIADNLARFIDPVFADPASQGGAAIWTAALCFTAQIYCDFSGYTDIARGLARMLGFRFPQNFDWPYFSASIQEFWRRWHMSLSFWIRDYLYLSLGGSRGTTARWLLNLAVTWFAVGLWHGAAATFILWGLYNGALLAIGRLANPGRFAPRPVQIGVTLLLVVLGWVLFRAERTADVAVLWGRMLAPWQTGFFELTPLQLALLPGLALLYLLNWMAYRLKYLPDRASLLLALPFPLRVATVTAAAWAILLLAGDTQSFIYFAF
jgi:alginate O-acetyltransferase complex protein AlgI